MSTFGAGADPAMDVPYSRGATFASAYDPNGPQYPAPTYAFVGHGAPGASGPAPPAYAGYAGYPTLSEKGLPAKEYV